MCLCVCVCVCVCVWRYSNTVFKYCFTYITSSMLICLSAGYAGRTELPDNLKSMFRPISMVVPDSTLIAEIILFGEGFSNTKVIITDSD